MIILSTTSNLQFGNEVARHLGIDIIPCEIDRFASGEVNIKDIPISLRGEDVYIIFSVCNNVNDEIIEASLLCHTVKYASAKTINLVVPYYPYARQDKKFKGRQPISARWFADLCKSSGVTSLISVDIHSNSIQGFFEYPIDNLTAIPIFAKYIWNNIISQHNKDDYVIVAPDAGGVTRCEHIAKKIGLGMAMMYKKRYKPNEVAIMTLQGIVKDKIAIIVDDMVDTCGTLKKATEILIENGAKEVMCFATHAPLSGKALENIMSSRLTTLYVTNSMNLNDKLSKCSKIKVLSISKLIAVTILAHSNNKSVSSLLKCDIEYEEILTLYRNSKVNTLENIFQGLNHN